MRDFCLLSLITASSLSGSNALARPVAFKGGWTLMSENRADQNEVMASYTPTPSVSTGAHLATYRVGDERRHFAFPVGSWLVHRWMSEASQANLYVTGGYGGSRTDASPVIRGAAFGAVEADFETRKIYVSGRPESADLLSNHSLEYHRARVGFAPYVTEFEGFHTWVLLEGTYRSWNGQFAAGPVLRFFYQNVLFELASDWRGQWQFNFTTEF